MKSLAGKLLLFAGSLALTLGVLELGFRILDIRGLHEERGLEWRRALKPASEVRPGLGLEFRPNTEFTHQYDGNPRGLDLWNQFRSAYEAQGWIRRSNLLSFIATRIGREVYGRSYVDELVRSALTRPDRWQKSFDALTRSKQLVLARGARFGVVIFPFMFQLDDGYPFRPLHEMVAAHCRAQGIPVLDLLPAFTGRDYLDLWVHPADQHPNEIGHAIAGKAMARFVLEQELLEGGDVER